LLVRSSRAQPSDTKARCGRRCGRSTTHRLRDDSAVLATGRARAALRRLALELAGLARLHVVTAAADLGEDPGALDHPLEGLQRPIDAVALFQLDLDHGTSCVVDDGEHVLRPVLPRMPLA